jgi:hypothetical protein
VSFLKGNGEWRRRQWRAAAEMGAGSIGSGRQAGVANRGAFFILPPSRDTYMSGGLARDSALLDRPSDRDILSKPNA